METLKKQVAPKWVSVISGLNSYLTKDLLGGPKIFKMAWVINLTKALTVFVIVSLMFWYNNYSTVAWVYLALHGTYGYCWLLKHVFFRDSRWEAKATIGGAIFLFLLLVSYWVAPYLLISDVLGPNRPITPDWLLALCICLHTFGLVIMMGADGQKYYTIKYRSGLITEGFFKYVRHPNYLGEMMIYTAYALLVQHWIPWAILAYWWFLVFYVNMLQKEASMSRYPEWEAYRASSGMVFPNLFIGKPSQ